jgi:hypothetical protein
MKATTGPLAQQGHQQKQGCLQKYSTACSEESNSIHCSALPIIMKNSFSNTWLGYDID